MHSHKIQLELGHDEILLLTTALEKLYTFSTSRRILKDELLDRLRNSLDKIYQANPPNDSWLDTSRKRKEALEE